MRSCLLLSGRAMMPIACLVGALLLGALPVLQAESCAELGFTASLLCSGCNQLADYVPDAELVAECRRCCAEDAVESDKKQVFVSAVLEYCPHSLRGYPHLETFVEKIAPDVDSLTLRKSLGVRPRLILKAEDGTRSSVRIDGWKTESIEEFVRSKLKGARELRGGWEDEDDDDMEDS